MKNIDIKYLLSQVNHSEPNRTTDEVMIEDAVALMIKIEHPLESFTEIRDTVLARGNGTGGWLLTTSNIVHIMAKGAPDDGRSLVEVLMGPFNEPSKPQYGPSVARGVVLGLFRAMTVYIEVRHDAGELRYITEFPTSILAILSYALREHRDRTVKDRSTSAAALFEASNFSSKETNWFLAGMSDWVRVAWTSEDALVHGSVQMLYDGLIDLMGKYPEGWNKNVVQHVLRGLTKGIFNLARPDEHDEVPRFKLMGQVLAQLSK